MKKFLRICTVSCSIILAIASCSQAASLSAIYDILDANGNPINMDTTSLEGLAFTDDGTLWITSAPDTQDNFGSLFQPDTLLEVQLDFNTNIGEVVSTSAYNQPTYLFSPVGLASNGTELFIANNNGGSVYSSTTTGAAAYLYGAGCGEPEGATYLNGFVYVSCEDTKNVVKLDSNGNIVESISFDQNLLGLGATGTALIVGKYGTEPLDRSLELYDVLTGEREVINLASLFYGENSDYFDLTGEVYDEFDRVVPDPDGIAYRNGKIFMSFEHDPRVFEISLDDTPPVPEPGTLFLIGTGLLALIGWKRKRS